MRAGAQPFDERRLAQLMDTAKSVAIGSIESITFRPISLPISDAKAITTSLGGFDRHHYVAVTVQCDGLTGSAYAWAFDEHEALAIAHLGAHVGRGLIGRSPASVDENWRSMLGSLRLSGRSGMGLFAVSAIDCCLWDLVAQASGHPLWRMFGGFGQASVPCYASGLFLSSDLKSLGREAEGYISAGFTAMKMRVGAPNGDDVARVGSIRSLLGKDVMLMLDAALSWQDAEAEPAIAALSQFQPAWIEDPIDYREGEEVGSLQRLKSLSPIPIAAGEFITGIDRFARAASSACAHILMMDVQHLGGITGCLHATVAANAAQVPIVGHIFPEVMVHFFPLVDASWPMEYIAWARRLFASCPEVVHGRLQVPDRPGLGYSFDEELIAATSSSTIKVSD